MSRRYKVLVCRGPTCGGEHSSARLREILDRAMQTEVVQRAGIEVELGWQSCFGRCAQAPNCLVRELRGAPEGRRLATMPVRKGRAALYSRLTPERMVDIVNEHLIRGRVVRHLLSVKPESASEAEHARPQVLTSVRGPEGGNR